MISVPGGAEQEPATSNVSAPARTRWVYSVALALPYLGVLLVMKFKIVRGYAFTTPQLSRVTDPLLG